MTEVETETAPPERDRYTPKFETLHDKLIFGIAALTSLSCIYFLWQRPLTNQQYLNYYLGLMFLTYFLIELYDSRPISSWTPKDWIQMSVFSIAILAGLAGTIYVHVNYEVLAFERLGLFTTEDTIAGAMLVLATIVATQRAYGNIITGVVVFTILLAVYGQQFPGILQHAGFEWNQYIQTVTVQFTGVYHTVSQIGATWIFVFLIWAGIIEEMEFLDVLFDVGFLFGKLVKSGVAQTAVVASMLMGSITGSPMANIAVTGSFTIPLMKERGLDGRVAGAIESVASTGGMVLPPIMGSVAFIMANFLGVSYGEIIISAALPALLFYAATIVSVHIIVSNYPTDLKVERDVDRDRIIKQGIPMALSLIGLVYLLVELRYPPGIAGVYAIAIIIVAQALMLMLLGGDRLLELWNLFEQIASGLVTGTIRMAPITIILAAMGILITSFNYTGIGFRLSLSIVDVSGGNVLVLLGLVMLAAIVLGMGMPTVAAYLVTVTLIAPAMVEFGFQEITAHFFVFYFAMIATITPPIALGPAIASQIAESDFIMTALTAMKVGLPLFILPYIFAFNEELLVIDGMNTVITFTVTLVGFCVLAYALHSPIMKSRGKLVSSGARIGIFVAGLAMIFFTQLFNLVA